MQFMNDLRLERKTNGTIERIIVGNSCFDVLPASLDSAGKITSSSLHDKIIKFYHEGNLKESPGEIYALTQEGKPVIIDIDYVDSVPVRAIADVWKEAPTIDAAIHFLAEKSKGQSLLLAPHNTNWKFGEDVPVPYKNDNTYGELSRIQQEVYNGFLKRKELIPCIGKRFGSRLGKPYKIQYFHKGNEIWNADSDTKPILTANRHIQHCWFEITSIHHRRFVEEEDTFLLNEGEPVFYQLLDVDLRYIEYARKH